VVESKADELRSSNAFPKDIVITHRGTLGQVGIIPENSRYNRYVASQSQMKLSCDETIANPYFVFYFLKSAVGQYLLLRSASPTGVPAIAQPLTTLKDIPLPLPRLSEQERIASILSSFDDAIENMKKKISVLEKLRDAILPIIVFGKLRVEESSRRHNSQKTTL
jgi:type I restriction enzyme S subunit